MKSGQRRQSTGAPQDDDAYGRPPVVPRDTSSDVASSSSVTAPATAATTQTAADEMPSSSSAPSPSLAPPAAATTATAAVTHPPHVHRLLRLIRSGTADHASRASVLLGSYARRSSPSVVWDLLGRLASSSSSSSSRGRCGGCGVDDDGGLASSQWTSRENSARAMEAVGKCLPVRDRRDFFGEEDGSFFSSSGDGGEDDISCSCLWLSVDDLAGLSGGDASEHVEGGKVDDVNEGEGGGEEGNDHAGDSFSASSPATNLPMDVILQRGRLLLASSGAKYEQHRHSIYEDDDQDGGGDTYGAEDEALRRLDSTAAEEVTKRKRSFLERRIWLQRQILARRLGLGGILSAPVVVGRDEGSSGCGAGGTDEKENLGGRVGTADFITDEDLLSLNATMSIKTECGTSSSQEPGSERERTVKRLRKRRREQRQWSKAGGNGGVGHSSRKRPRYGGANVKYGPSEKCPSSDNDTEQDHEHKKEEEEGVTLRALLVLEARRAAVSSSLYGDAPEGGSASMLSHRNPQLLLATDLVYRTFDPDWRVRHGALLGTLALLKAWRAGGAPSRQVLQTDTLRRRRRRQGVGEDGDGGEGIEAAPFGRWPSDILARCLCVLALDRFGDYSGGWTASSSSSGESAAGVAEGLGGVVAPVRETAAQLLAMLISAAPLTVRQKTYGVLERLAGYKGGTRGDAWEVRHGAMLGFKYVAVLLALESSPEGKENGDNDDDTDDGCSNIIARLAVRGLSDPSDDVRATAAQVLSCLLRGSRDTISGEGEAGKIVRACAVPLWSALDDARGVSSCASDLLSLFAEALSRDCPLVLRSIGSSSAAVATRGAPSSDTVNRVMRRLTRFLSFESVSVRLSCLRALGHVARPVARTMIAAPPFDRGDIAFTYCALIQELFESYFDSANALFCVPEEYGDTDKVERSVSEHLCYARDEAWSKIVENVPVILSKETDVSETVGGSFRILLYDTVISLLLRFVGINRAVAPKASLATPIPHVNELSVPRSELRTSPSQQPAKNEEEEEDEDKEVVGRPISLKTNSSEVSRNRESFGKGEVAASKQFAFMVCAADALARLCTKLSRSGNKSFATVSSQEQNRCDFLSNALKSLLNSPWIRHCEGACLLIRAIALQTESEHKHDASEQIDDAKYDLISLLSRMPNCIMIEADNKVAAVRDDDEIADACDRVLLDALNKAADADARALPLSELFEDVSLPHTMQSWRRVFQSKGVDPPCFSSCEVDTRSILTSNSMRLSASIAGSIVCLGAEFLPPKLTPLIRALITSLKNEDVCTRQERNSQNIARLVKLLSSQTSHFKACEKVIETICRAVCEDNVEIVGASPTLKGAVASRRVLELLVGDIPIHGSFESVVPIWARLQPLASMDPAASGDSDLYQAIHLLCIISPFLKKGSKSLAEINRKILPSTVLVACASPVSVSRQKAVTSASILCKIDPVGGMLAILPVLIRFLRNLEDDPGRLGGCQLLSSIVSSLGVSVCPLVRSLLPAAMPLIADPIEDCSRLATSIFASLVRMAPLVTVDDDTKDLLESAAGPYAPSDKVIDHLIHGRPLPPCVLPDKISAALKRGGVELRHYQVEGVSWIRFLQSVKLNGALCDDMGLGKTLQTLIGIGMSHVQHSNEQRDKGRGPISLVVCPSTLVGHWVNEIEKYFPGSDCFRPLQYAGPTAKRKSLWAKDIDHCNIVITSYSTLRTDADLLTSKVYEYCILDEGHLLKNPKTATAKAARRVKAQHKLILTGTPVQNRVQELWAVFDFLMPNFLGSETFFAKEFAKPIINGQLPGACAENISKGMEKLKVLHQQVLPFILRREKEQVMKELPPKTITDIPCFLSEEQSVLYSRICEAPEAKKALEIIGRECIEASLGSESRKQDATGKEVLRYLLYLRLICTHPILAFAPRLQKEEGEDRKEAKESHLIEGIHYNNLQCSGKLLVLNDLLRNAGIFHEEMTAADNDQSSLYIEGMGESESESDCFMALNDSVENNYFRMEDSDTEASSNSKTGSKCLIFAQFTQSLDIVERFLFQPHMPSLRYLRLDGRVPPEKRTQVTDRFNNDESIKVMLLTTKVGGLGLNLTGADTVILLEHDWNPHVDLQAMDRAHRMGQKRAVSVYRLVTANTVEEKVMKLQKVKLAMSQAIVNSENSTLYSMGTDRLLDLFTCDYARGQDASRRDQTESSALDQLLSKEYSSLSVDGFLQSISGS